MMNGETVHLIDSLANAGVVSEDEGLEFHGHSYRRLTC